MTLLSFAVLSGYSQSIKKSFYGEYSSSDNFRKEFVSVLEWDNDSKNLMSFSFENSLDSVVVVEFPFNWHPQFIGDTLFLGFRIVEDNKVRIESFYPDRIDTVNNFFSSPMFVLIPSKSKLKFISEINRIEGESWGYKLKFNYYVFRKKSRRFNFDRSKKRLFVTGVLNEVK